MSKQERLRAPRGMPDTLPDRIAPMRRLEASARRVFALYGYEEIRTPLFEETRLFVRGIGEATDIVEKEMYTFETDDASLTLRPEATAPVVRAVVEHNLLKQRAFWKLYYIGPMFRKERPQAGRLRQFDQIGVEAIGSLDPMVDAESILLAGRFFDEIGLDAVTIKLNTIGCERCRADYRDALRAHFQPHRDALCAECQSRFDRNIFRVLDCKNPQCKSIALAGPVMRDYLDEGCREHFAAVTARLEAVGRSFVIDDHLVRGFDYYTRTVFELVHPALGARDAVCGGGRYDNLVKELGGPSAGCVGFAVGVVPTLLALEQIAGNAVGETAALKVYVVAVDDEARADCFALTEQLRRAGISTDLDCERRSLKAQMRSANKTGAQYTVVIGPDEVRDASAKLKTMASGEEETLSQDALIARLRDT